MRRPLSGPGLPLLACAPAEADGCVSRLTGGDAGPPHVERIKQYPAQEQVELKVHVGIPWNEGKAVLIEFIRPSFERGANYWSVGWSRTF